MVVYHIDTGEKMKKTLIVLLFWAAMAANAQSAGTTLYVSAKAVEVKSSAGFFAGIVGRLSLGEEVIVIQSGGKWLAVRNASGLQGWAPADAFSSRRFVRSGSEVSVTEFALAGKGFSSDLEQIIGSSENVDYSGVDVMEKRAVSPDDLLAFLREGRLAEGE
jgi:hypothetical protein